MKIVRIQILRMNVNEQINEKPGVCEDPYAANSDIDPDFEPLEEENINKISAENAENEVYPVIIKNKGKNSDMRKIGRKRARNIR